MPDLQCQDSIVQPRLVASKLRVLKNLAELRRARGSHVERAQSLSVKFLRSIRDRRRRGIAHNRADNRQQEISARVADHRDRMAQAPGSDQYRLLMFEAGRLG